MLKTCLPMLQEITLRCDAKTDNHEGKRDLPITRLRHHLSRFRVNSFHCFSPLGIVGFCLSGLPKEGENGISKGCDGNSLPSQLDAIEISKFLQRLSSR